MNSRLRAVPATPHGGGSPHAIDLSASLNPLGPSPAALQAAGRAELGRYPEVDAAALAAAAAARHGVATEQVVPVPGASWGLWLALVSFLGDGTHALSLGPCFGEYGRYATIAGASHRETRCRSLESGWGPSDLDAALADSPTVCVVANPANPAGTRIEAVQLRRVCEAHPGTLVLVDEAFVGFAPPGTSLLDAGPLPANALVVRSLTKELGLPGLRMGYLVGPRELAAPLTGLMPAWPLSAPAIAAAVAGMADSRHLDEGARVARLHLALVADALRAAGLAPLPSAANYLLCEAPDLARRLHERGIAVRDCASFALPGFVRIAAPRADQLRPVLQAIRG